MISAVGVVGNIENLGLEKLGVKTERGAIVIDPFNRTNVPGIYAIGDVAGPPLLAHKAEHEGVICVEAIKGLHPHAMDKRLIPGCTYCTPQIASVGLTEAAAKAKNIDVRVGKFPFVGNGKAIALGEDQGLVKVIFDKKTGQLLGAHMVGAEVTELIQGFVVAMNLETTEEELMHTVFPHPTIVGNDEGSGAGRLWAGVEHLNPIAMRNLDDAGAAGKLFDQRIGGGAIVRIEIGIPFVEQIDRRVGVVDDLAAVHESAARRMKNRAVWVARAGLASPISSSSSSGSLPCVNWKARRSAVGQ